MAGLVVVGILALIFIAVMVRSYFMGKKIGTYPKGGLLGRTKGYSSPIADSKPPLPDSQTKKDFMSQDAGT
jgi:hypothetical protein